METFTEWSVRVQNLNLIEYEANRSLLTLINQETAAWACYLETGEWVPGETTELNGCLWGVDPKFVPCKKGTHAFYCQTCSIISHTKKLKITLMVNENNDWQRIY